MKEDILKMVAYFKVYGLDLYGVKYHGYDAGKDNLVSYFRRKLGWTRKRLDATLKVLKDEQIITRRKADVGSKLYGMNPLFKTSLNFIEIN